MNVYSKGKKRRQFWRSAQLGTGRALLIMRQNPKMDFSGEIIHLATHNPAYDPQCEGTRARYVFSLVKEGGLFDPVAQVLLETIPKVDLDSWDANHQVELAWLLVDEGYESLRRAIYERYSRSSPEEGFWVLEREIVHHDGLEGLLVVAEKNALMLRQNPQATPDFWIYSQALEKSLVKIQEAAERKPEIKLFLDSYHEYKEQEEKKKNEGRQEGPDFYEVVVQFIHSEPATRRYSVPRRWIRKLSHEQLVLLARHFLETEDEKQRHLYLTIFSKRRFPLGLEPLLQLLRKPLEKNDWSLLESLAHFSAPEVRSLAMESLKKDSRIIFWNLLKHNYREGDGAVLAERIKSFRSPYKIHDAAGSCIEIYEERQTQDCREPLLALYEKCPCSICRSRIVGLLRKSGVCSPEIEAEFPFDTDSLSSDWE